MLEETPPPPSAATPAVVLVRPSEEGNVGSAARAMANMGLERMLLVEPAAPIGDTARAFAVGARPILDNAERCASLEEALGPFRRVVGTTSHRARSLDIPLVSQRDLPGHLAADPPGTETALVFGPERSGLTTDELALCSPLVRIRCAPAQPTLNLAQAVLLVAWELFYARVSSSAAEDADSSDADVPVSTPATVAEVEGLFSQVEPLLGEIGFARDTTFAGVLRDLRQLAARAGLSEREVQILRGLCRRSEHALRLRDAPSPATGADSSSDKL